MSNEATKCLKSLLDKTVSEPDRRRDVLFKQDRFSSIKSDPYPFKRAEDNRDFHESLALAESKGCILLEWEKDYEGTNLLRIRLRDAKKLADFLNVPYTPDLVELAIKAIQFPPNDHWLYKEVHEIINAWCSSKKKHNVSYEQVGRLNNAIEAVMLLEDSPELMNYRQFGARYFGDSKIIDKELKTVIGKLLKAHYGYADLDHDDVLAEFNLVKMRHPFAISGPIIFSDDKANVSASIRPYVAVPDVLFDNAELIQQPDYLLTIENWSSYFEYTEKFQDNAIILYTGGYPSRRLQEFYRYLAQQVTCPLYHWGDSDPDGFQILKVFQKQACDKVVNPHAMQSTSNKTFSDEQIKKIKRLLSISVNPPTDAILESYLETKVGLEEQESQVAVSPDKI